MVYFFPIEMQALCHEREFRTSAIKTIIFKKIGLVYNAKMLLGSIIPKCGKAKNI